MIRLDIPNMDETIRALTASLQHMPKECEIAVSRAINRTLNAMRAEAIRIARRAYVYVPPGRLFEQLYLKTAQKAQRRLALHFRAATSVLLRSSPEPSPRRAFRRRSGKAVRGRSIRNPATWNKRADQYGLPLSVRMPCTAGRWERSSATFPLPSKTSCLMC